jgi:hypothetical protein
METLKGLFARWLEKTLKIKMIHKKMSTKSWSRISPKYPHNAVI